MSEKKHTFYQVAHKKRTELIIHPRVIISKVFLYLSFFFFLFFLKKNIFLDLNRHNKRVMEVGVQCVTFFFQKKNK